jgi:hypothetical protein
MRALSAEGDGPADLGPPLAAGLVIRLAIDDLPPVKYQESTVDTPLPAEENIVQRI